MVSLWINDKRDRIFQLLSDENLISVQVDPTSFKIDVESADTFKILISWSIYIFRALFRLLYWKWAKFSILLLTFNFRCLKQSGSENYLKSCLSVFYSGWHFMNRATQNWPAILSRRRRNGRPHILHIFHNSPLLTINFFLIPPPGYCYICPRDYRALYLPPLQGNIYILYMPVPRGQI